MQTKMMDFDDDFGESEVSPGIASPSQLRHPRTRRPGAPVAGHSPGIPRHLVPGCACVPCLCLLQAAVVLMWCGAVTKEVSIPCVHDPKHQLTALLIAHSQLPAETLSFQCHGLQDRIAAEQL